MKRFQKISARCQFISELILPTRPIESLKPIVASEEKKMIEVGHAGDAAEGNELIEKVVEPEETPEQKAEREKKEYMEAYQYVGNQR